MSPRIAILLSLLSLLFLFACADKTPPTWPAEALLELESTTDTATVSWPEPSDDRGVARIVVRLGDSVAAELDGSARRFVAEDLDDEADFRFEVFAEDEEGNRSEALVGATRTADGTAPHWPGGALVEHQDGSLRWSRAEDGSGVKEYEVRQGSEVLTTTAETSFAFEGDPSGIEVVARDEAGNTSAPIAWREGALLADVAEDAPEPVDPEDLRVQVGPSSRISNDLREQLRRRTLDRAALMGGKVRDRLQVERPALQQYGN